MFLSRYERDEECYGCFTEVEEGGRILVMKKLKSVGVKHELSWTPDSISFEEEKCCRCLIWKVLSDR